MRPGWDEYFLDIARAVAARGDCFRRRVGAVLVDSEHRIVSTGYNGVAPEERGCLAGGCPRAHSGVEPGSSYDTGPGACIASHAEANALLRVRETLAPNSCTLYVTSEICDGCLRLVSAANYVGHLISG